MKKTSPMRKLYDSRLFWMIVSFLAALAMWVYFSSTDAEEMTKIFRGVRVELVGEDELRNSRNMVITDLDTNSVTVEVSRQLACLPGKTFKRLFVIDKIARRRCIPVSSPRACHVSVRNPGCHLIPSRNTRYALTLG